MVCVFFKLVQDFFPPLICVRWMREEWNSDGNIISMGSCSGCPENNEMSQKIRFCKIRSDKILLWELKSLNKS